MPTILTTTLWTPPNSPSNPEHKTAANKAFTAGELSSALESWAEAIKVFEGRSGDEAQRLEKSKVHSNQAEAYLRRKEYDKARRCADSALDCDPINLKALFRRARDCLRWRALRS